jgi:hypothetical protein
MAMTALNRAATARTHATRFNRGLSLPAGAMLIVRLLLRPETGPVRRPSIEGS